MCKNQGCLFATELKKDEIRGYKMSRQNYDE